MSTDSTFGLDSQQPLSCKLLVQYSGAVVDPYTDYVASIMCKDLHPGPQGQRLVNSALSNLPNFLTPDEKLSFGWGFESIIRNQEVHNGGYEHLAMMSALAESFHSSWAAEICHEWAMSIAGPNDSLPHLSQWVAILQSCNGALVAIDLGVTVEDYIRLDPYSLTFGGIKSQHIPISAKEIVAALHALSAVVKGVEKELTLTGSAVLGWFAAVAEVLYDLDVAVFSTQGDSLSSTKSGKDPQLRIIYRERVGIEITSNIKSQDLAHPMSNLGISSQQYAKAKHETPFGGRVLWQSLLPRVFGESFGRLEHSENKAFSGMLGAGARMFEGLALGESAEEDLISPQNKANPSSYGAGLIETLSNWLPELRRYQSRMERALKLDYHNAAAAYVENITKLREACHCGICFSKPGDENEGHGPDHGYCLVTMTEVVLAMGLALSRITVAAQMSPARAGIQKLYAAQVTRRLEARGQKWQTHFRIVYGNEWNGSAPRRLQTICALFSGSLPTRDLPENLVALAHEGIVAYFLKLQKASTPKKDEEAIIRVSSGHINVRQKLFKRACLGVVKDTEVEDLWEAVEVEHLDLPLYCK